MWNTSKIKQILTHCILQLALSLLPLLFVLPAAQGQTAKSYDISYFWDTDLSSVLDYKEELSAVLGPKAAKQLKVVGQGNRYGVVYERNGTALSSARVAVWHNSILAAVDMQAGTVIDDQQYFDLYNVSYGLGKDLSALTRQYGLIYRYLGKDVGKDLFIEKTANDHYVLVYRRLGNRTSSRKIAARHVKVLQRKGLSASIALEHNNEIVFGESNYLQKNDKSVGRTAAKASKPAQVVNASRTKKSSQGKLAGEAGKGATALENAVEKYIKQLRRKRKIASDEQTAWLVYDFTSNRNLVDINSNKSLQSASMIKPFVALAFFLKVKEGRLHYGPKSRRKMEAMIQHSDNNATNWLMRYVGGPRAVERTLRNYYGDIFQQTKVLEYIPAHGKTYRNRVAPRDYGKFLDALWNKKLAYGKEIRRLMALPNRDRLYHGTTIPRGTLVFDKTGTTARLCGDMGILAPKGRDGRRYPYIFVGVIEKQKRTNNYGRWMSARGNVIRKVSDLVYNTLKEEHHLL